MSESLERQHYFDRDNVHLLVSESLMVVAIHVLLVGILSLIFHFSLGEQEDFELSSSSSTPLPSCEGFVHDVLVLELLVLAPSAHPTAQRPTLSPSQSPCRHPIKMPARNFSKMKHLVFSMLVLRHLFEELCSG